MTYPLAIIQARSGSTRLPKKALRIICGRPLLWHVIMRVKKSQSVAKVILATTTRPEDRALVRVADACRVESFTGSDHDVLDRYYQAAVQFGGDPIIRITGDCPLIDPAVIDEVLAFYLRKQPEIDYTFTPALYPEGNDTEVFSFASLKEAWRHARKPSEREHVTPYIKEHATVARIEKKGTDYSGMHWSVDERQDLRFVRSVYRHLYSKNHFFSMDDILALLKKYPKLLKINEGLTGYEGYQTSLKQDLVWQKTHH